MATSHMLAEANPWWGSKNAILEDYNIVEWNRSSVKQAPRITGTFEHDQDLVYILRGPRQVGKTTLLKLQIKDLLDSGVEPQNVMYYSFDLEQTPESLADVVKSYLNNTEKNQRRHLFLDEITSVPSWQYGIKHLWDNGWLINCTTIATGSHAADLRDSAERLPGRRGYSDAPLDKTLMPMKFAEYASCVDHGIAGKLQELGLVGAGARLGVIRGLLECEIDPRLEDLRVYLPALERHLYDYMVTGGIPHVVNKYVETKKISESVYSKYRSAILSELGHLGKQRRMFEQMVPNLIKSMGHTSSWDSLRKGTHIRSTNTVSDYVDALEDMFVLLVLHQYNYETRRNMLRKAKKIHAIDPFYLHVLHRSNNAHFESSLQFLEDGANVGAVVEGVVATHLRQMTFGKAIGNLYYWRYKGREVDFVHDNGLEPPVPIEVKFQNSINARDFDGITSFRRLAGGGPGILVTSEDMGIRNHVAMVPAPLFLLLA